MLSVGGIIAEIFLAPTAIVSPEFACVAMPLFALTLVAVQAGVNMSHVLEHGRFDDSGILMEAPSQTWFESSLMGLFDVRISENLYSHD